MYKVTTQTNMVYFNSVKNMHYIEHFVFLWICLHLMPFIHLIKIFFIISYQSQLKMKIFNKSVN